MITIVLIALIAHLLGDFVFQTDKIKNGRFPGEANAVNYKRIVESNVKHSLLQGIITLILIVFTTYIAAVDLYTYIPKILAIVIFHFIIDMCKSIIILKKKDLINNVWVFIMDQIAHIVSIILIFNICNMRGFIDEVFYIVSKYPYNLEDYDKVLLVLLILLASTFGTGYLAKVLLNSIGSNENKLKIEAKNGGFTIGILERLFIIIGIVIKQPSIIAFILTLKSIARYKKFSEDTFVEYFIVGTFISLVIAIIGGVLISKIISLSII